LIPSFTPSAIAKTTHIKIIGLNIKFPKACFQVV
jgi:hypothetical protein